MQTEFSSILLENAVKAFSSLPGVGRKTALRLALNILRRSDEDVEKFTQSLNDFKHNIKHCSICNNLSDNDVCDICANPNRDSSLICVVQNVQDVMAIENTQQYKGLYHVLGGIISPMDGIGPSDIKTDSLVQRVAEGKIKEVIFAISSTTDGETTVFYITRKLEKYNVKLSTIARGVSVGEELEYSDEITLGRSILNRININ